MDQQTADLFAAFFVGGMVAGALALTAAGVVIELLSSGARHLFGLLRNRPANGG